MSETLSRSQHGGGLSWAVVLPQRLRVWLSLMLSVRFARGFGIRTLWLTGLLAGLAFADEGGEHDALEDFRSRLGFHAGKFATLAETDDCVFKGLVGIGTSKEFEGSDTDWTPELYLGSSLEKSINDRPSASNSARSCSSVWPTMLISGTA